MTKLIVVVELGLADDVAEEFVPLVRENAAASLREEPGCRRFDVCLDPADPTTLLLYEVYDDEPAFAAHLASPHFLAFDAATTAMIRTKTVRKLTLAE